MDPPSTAPASAVPGRLLAGERAHYALAAGHRDEAEALLTVMENSTPDTAACCPNKSGTPPTFPISGTLSRQAYGLSLSLSCGRIRSTSSCAARFAMAKFRPAAPDRKALSQVDKTVAAASLAGGLTIRRGAFPATKPCASCCSPLAGALEHRRLENRARHRRRATRDWAPTFSILPTASLAGGRRRRSSLFSGPKKIVGRERIFESPWSNPCGPAYAYTAPRFDVSGLTSALA